MPKSRVTRKLRKRPQRACNGGRLEEPERGTHHRGVVFCPKCGSSSVFWASGSPHLWSIWECRRCGYRGAFIVRDGKLAEKVRENYESRMR